MRGDERAWCPVCWWVCEGDAALRAWLAERFTDKTREPVLVSYGSRAEATVAKNDLVRTQCRLADGRLVRVDWSSPQRRGERGSYIVTIERPAPTSAG